MRLFDPEMKYPTLSHILLHTCLLIKMSGIMPKGIEEDAAIQFYSSFLQDKSSSCW